MAKRKYLKAEEMEKLDKLNLQVRVFELELEIIKNKRSLLAYGIDKEITAKAQEIASSKDKRTKFNEVIKKDFKIQTETWSYDPQSGEVIYE